MDEFFDGHSGIVVVNGQNADDFGMVIGVRNSHDKSFPAGLVVGASVFVCDNLSFSGEIKLARKHTSNINRDLPQLISRAKVMDWMRRTVRPNDLELHAALLQLSPGAHLLAVRELTEAGRLHQGE